MNETARQQPHAAWLTCVVALAAHAALLAWSASRNSVTFDEYAHLPAGVAYLKYREFSIHNLSPPLLRMLAAWPAVLDGADAPPASSYRKYDPRQRHWIYAEAFMRANFGQQYHRFFVLGRFAMIPWSCLGGLIVFAWAKRLYGDLAGAGAVWVYALEPNILAHASLVGTDAGAATAMLAAAWLWDRFCREPKPMNAMFASLATAAAILCKFTALLIVPVVLAITLVYFAWSRTERKRILTGLALAAIVVPLVINLAYGYDKSFQRLDKFEFQSPLLMSIQKHLPGATPMPLPRHFVLGFDTQKFESELPVPAFALGRRYDGTRWWYYPLVLACKLPLSMWGLIALSLVSMSSRHPSRSELAPLVLIATYLIGVALLGNVNIGIRYILPIIPPAIVLAARGFASARWIRIASSFLLVTLTIEIFATAPRFISFFSIAAGGPSRGQFILNDSNFDWGQDLLALRQWMRRNGVARVALAYFGRVDPAIYGIAYTPLVDSAREDLVAVSSYYLIGMPHRMPTSRGPTDYLSLPYAQQLQKKQPVAHVGSTFWIFRRDDVEEAKREWESQFGR